MPGIKLVVFDIAGTIIEDRGEVVTAFANALRKSGIRYVKDELKEWKGASKREVIRHFVERENNPTSASVESVEGTYRLFRSELEDLYRAHITPIQDADATFAWCREHGIQLATTTGFYAEIRDMILDQAGWRDSFSANICSSDVKRGRPAPYMIFRAMEASGVEDVRQVANVGDTLLDLQAGTNAGVRGVIGVLTGMQSAEQLRRAPHTHLLPSVADLPYLIEHSF
jgi:phosphonatase-like hydrolase